MYDRYRMTLEACGDVSGKSVLDVGCGSGRFMIPLAEKSATVTGLDPAPSMLKIAEGLSEQHGVRERCRFVTGDVQSFPTGEQFDVVLGVGLFDYLVEPVDALRRMIGMARECVVLTFPFRWTYRAPIRKLRLAMHGCPVYFYSRRQVYDLVESAGGQVERFEVIGKIYFVVVRPS